MLLKNKICADAGTANCPCYLAECGKCIVCSRLGRSDFCGTKDDISIRSPAGNPGSVSGPAVCDCQWQGICIYNEYLQNNMCIKEPVSAFESGSGLDNGAEHRRRNMLCKIQKIKWFKNDLAVMRIAVPRGFAEKAALPGSFVFVKIPGMEDFFELPLSVMRSDYEAASLEIAVRVSGPKSQMLMDYVCKDKAKKSLINDLRNGGDKAMNDGLQIGDSCSGIRERAVSEYVEVRGIYRNGMLGISKLMDKEPKRVLCLTRGVGLAPVANYIRWAEGRDRIDIISDLDNISREFAEYAMLDGWAVKGIASVTYGSLPLDMTWAQEEKYDVILISASDYYQQNIYVPEGKAVLSNNHRMCCGEGVCGACMCIGRDGKEHRTCKECCLL